MARHVSPSGEGLLVVSKIDSQNGKASLGGKEVQGIQTDQAMLGVQCDLASTPLKPGGYERDRFTLGLRISGLSGAGVLAVCGCTG